MILLNFGYAPLDINQFETLEEKLEMVISFFGIKTIFCEVREEEIRAHFPSNRYEVVDVLVPGGEPAYIKSKMMGFSRLLDAAFDDHVKNEEDHYTIRKTLENAMDRCQRLSKENDVTRSLSGYVNEIIFLTRVGDHWTRVNYGELNFDANVRNRLTEQFALRKEFYTEMIEIIDRHLARHLEVLPYPRKPYKWSSNNPHLEIAELLEALIQTRIKVETGYAGSISKLVKEFYNLFGLDEGQYHQRLQTIRKRQKKVSWIRELVEYTERPGKV